MSTDEQKNIIGGLLYDIDQMERELSCYKAKLSQLMDQLRRVITAVESGALEYFDEKTGHLLVRTLPGHNEVSPISYPTAKEIGDARQSVIDKKDCAKKGGP